MRSVSTDEELATQFTMCLGPGYFPGPAAGRSDQRVHRFQRPQISSSQNLNRLVDYYFGDYRQGKTTQSTMFLVLCTFPVQQQDDGATNASTISSVHKFPASQNLNRLVDYYFGDYRQGTTHARPCAWPWVLSPSTSRTTERATRPPIPASTNFPPRRI